jgi:serine phosphatase RsbU (regulator of sigma subunit)/Tfp pilus assembly protein PilF
MFKSFRSFVPGYLLAIAFGILFTSGLAAQISKADSCALILKKQPEDRKTRKVYAGTLRKANPDSAFKIFTAHATQAVAVNNLSAAGDWNYYAAQTLDNQQKNTEAIPFYRKALEQLKTVRDTFNLDDAQNSFGYLLLRMGEYKEALVHLEDALAYREFVKDTMGKAGVHLHIGLLYNSMGDYTKSLEHYFICLEYAEPYEDSDPGFMGKIMNNIGSVYMNQDKDEDALRFYRKSVYYKSKAGSRKDLASTYNNIGSIYSETRYDSALYYYNLALEIRSESKDLRGLGIVHKNIGEVYLRQSKLKEAEEHLTLSLQYREKINDQTGIASSLISMGRLREKQGKLSEGLAFVLRADTLARTTNSLVQELDAAIALRDIYKAMGNYKSALEYASVAIVLKDSLLNEASDRHSEEMRARYDMDMQTKELEKLKMMQRETELKAESERAFYKVLIGAGIVVLFLVILFFLLRARENKRAQNRLQHAYDQIETKNKDITDSIRYAKRIQQAILPDDHSLSQAFPDSFVFYRPKDIVSGDFYWYHHTDEIKLVAVADCTGHGVPGAFMSVLGASQLTSVIAEQGELSPSRILTLIDDGIKNQLHQDQKPNGENSGSIVMNDSMDIALCAFDKRKGTLTFCGANRPIIVYRKGGDLEILRPAKCSVGGDSSRKEFHEITVQLNPGDSFYLFTDGFADQFGGPKGKKFKTSRFKDVLLQIAGQEIRQQKREIELIFDSWRGEFEQVDDVCVIGIRV